MALSKEKTNKIKWWHFGLAFLVMLPISAYLLRQNNLRMLELRDNVVDIDQSSGNIEDIEPALQELRDFVFGHMNASLPAPLELPGSFNVSVEQARKQAEQSGNADGGIYRDAQAECERADVPLSVRAECIQNYVITNSEPGQEAQQLDLPPKEQFVYNYVSPTLSFDLAGLATVVAAVLFMLALAKLTLDVVFPKLTKYITKQPLE